MRRPLVPLVLALPGCGMDAVSADAGYAIDDSAGVRITTVQLALEDLPEWRVAADPLLVVDGGGSEGSPFLERVTTAAWTSEDGIVVLDRQADQLHLFDRRGSYVRSFGQSGDGPGEFGNIAVVTVASDDSILVFDRAHRRISLFHPDAGFVRDVSVRSDSAGAYPIDSWAVAPNRILVYTIREDLSWVDGFDGRPIVTQAEAVLTVVDGTGVRRAGPLVFPGQRSIQFSWGSGGMPLAPRPYFAAGPGGIVYGTGERYELRQLDSELRVISLLRWPGLREPITEADRAEVRTRTEATFSEAMPHLVDEVVEASLSKDAVPDLRPAHGPLVLGSDGRIWVSRYEPFAEAGSWHVFGTDGRPAGRLQLPDRSRLLAADSTRVLVVTLDSLDVPSLYVFAIDTLE